MKGVELTYRQQKTSGVAGASGGKGEDIAPPPAQLRAPQQSVDTDPTTGVSTCRVTLPTLAPDTELPRVALLSCVRNVRDVFELLHWTYYTLNYPRDKLMWLIADDSARDE